MSELLVLRAVRKVSAMDRNREVIPEVRERAAEIEQQTAIPQHLLAKSVTGGRQVTSLRASARDHDNKKLKAA